MDTLADGLGRRLISGHHHNGIVARHASQHLGDGKAVNARSNCACKTREGLDDDDIFDSYYNMLISFAELKYDVYLVSS